MRVHVTCAQKCAQTRQHMLRVWTHTITQAAPHPHQASFTTHQHNHNESRLDPTPPHRPRYRSCERHVFSRTSGTGSCALLFFMDMVTPCELLSSPLLFFMDNGGGCAKYLHLYRKVAMISPCEPTCVLSCLSCRNRPAVPTASLTLPITLPKPHMVPHSRLARPREDLLCAMGERSSQHKRMVLQWCWRDGARVRNAP